MQYSGDFRSSSEGGTTSGRSTSWIRGCEAKTVLMYESEKGVNGVLMQRTVKEMRSSRSIRRFANSRADTKWPIPGEGMKMSSDFFIFVWVFLCFRILIHFSFFFFLKWQIVLAFKYYTID